DLGLAGSVNPHAPYTVSPALLKKIGNYAYETDAVLTLHNQECVPENQMFETGNGEMMEVLMQLGIDMSSFKPTGFTSMPSTLVHMPNCVPLLLVHNSVSTEKDIRWALDYHSQLTWCLCPKANLYIEDRLPDVTMLRQHDLRLVIGTDGLTSNDRLSILDEMQTIHSHFPEVTFPEMLSWSTINGARFLGISNRFGSIEKGKAPGLNLISGLDVQNVKLKPGVSLQTLRP
ncbi:MAG: amidohydrolase family protein, partial [Flavobacteriales bacterium]|nr:amidohydrolase family protein [Flavobacteriales bacterium]